MTDEARRAANVAMLIRFAGRDDGSALSASELTHLIDKARAERDREPEVTGT